MNKRSKIYIALAINSCALFLSSCDLDLVPLNDVTLEKYWTEKEDVQSLIKEIKRNPRYFEKETGINGEIQG